MAWRETAHELIRRASVTPDDAGCQALLAEQLSAYGFQSESMRFGLVDNLWARRGTSGPLLVFAGHTDVVPPGPAERDERPVPAGDEADAARDEEAAGSIRIGTLTQSGPRTAGSTSWFRN